MAAIIADVSSIFTAAIGWVGTVVTTITAEGNELLLIFAVLPLVGLGVGLTKRLLNLN